MQTVSSKLVALLKMFLSRACRGEFQKRNNTSFKRQHSGSRRRRQAAPRYAAESVPVRVIAVHGSVRRRLQQLNLVAESSLRRNNIKACFEDARRRSFPNKHGIVMLMLPGTAKTETDRWHIMK
jgi:hypothetical protein